MKIKIYGCRGSWPVSSRQEEEIFNTDGSISGTMPFETKIYGGSTTCVGVLDDAKQMHFFDTGYGLINAGKDIKKLLEGGSMLNTINVFYSHTHQDHVEGFHLSALNLGKGLIVSIHSATPKDREKLKKEHTGRLVNMSLVGVTLESLKQNDALEPREDIPQIENTLKKSVQTDRSPVKIGEHVSFLTFPANELGYKLNSKTIIDRMGVYHPGSCLSYRLKDTNSGKTFVFLTDFEPTFDNRDEKYIEWMRDADLVYMDGQYEKESVSNPFYKGFGHSDAYYSVELAAKANAKKVLIGHHSPSLNDTYLSQLDTNIKKHGRNLKIEALLAKEGKIHQIN